MGFSFTGGSGAAFSQPATGLEAQEYSYLDQIVPGTMRATRAIVVDANKAINEFYVGTQADVYGSGTSLAAQTKAVGFYADDGDSGAVTGNRRCLVARTLLTKDNAVGVSYRSVIGQLKLLSGVDVTSVDSVLAGTMGYLEIAGNTTLGGQVAAGEFTVESAGNLTVSSGAVLAGVASRLNMTAAKTITETGTACAFLVDVTGDAGDKWPKGFYAKSDSVDTGLYIGNKSNVAGDGLSIIAGDATNNTTGCNCLFADDAGVGTTVGDRRNLWVRTLVTIDTATAFSIRSAVSQLKLLSGVDITSATSVVAAHMGYLEIAGDTTLAGQVAVGEFTVESAGNLTVSSGGVLAGVASRLNMDSGKTITETGKACAFLADATGGMGDKWPKGFYAPADSIDLGIVIGDKSNVAGDGASLIAGNAADDTIGVNRFFADDAGVGTTVGDRRNLWVRTLLTIDTATAFSVRSAVAQLKLNSGVDITNASTQAAALMGYLELDGDTTFGCQMAVGEYTMEMNGNLIVSANSEVYGVSSKIKAASGKTVTETGRCAAYFAGTTGDGADSWPAVLHIDGADYVLSFESGTNYEDGIKVGTITSVGGDAGVTAQGVIRMRVGNTAYYIPFFDVSGVTGE
jgi:hypothetical protein